MRFAPYVATLTCSFVLLLSGCSGPPDDCLPGYERPTGTTACHDIDECSAGSAACDPHAVCTNSPGSYTCACVEGYSGDGRTCVAGDTCAGGKAGCHASATCTDSDRGPTCTCNEGFSGDGKSCTDVDECAAKTAECNANATCTNTVGGYTCACKPGFAGDGRNCDDVDECGNGSFVCDKNAACQNTEGSYTCLCNEGYAGDGKSCADVDECAAATSPCDSNATCANTAGSFTCTCKDGWVGDGRSCEDQDECSMSICSGNATCTNSAGSYTCVCNQGYTGNGILCDDINECASGVLTCGNQATCVNLPGSAECRCLPGYDGDGQTCVDIDECGANPPVCSLHASCVNTPGSVTCTCLQGYEGDGRTCTDIDECTRGTATCPAQAACINTAGGYTCQCPTGYRLAQGACAEVDECLEHLDDCHPTATCTNTVGSYTCACGVGATGDGRTCTQTSSASVTLTLPTATVGGFATVRPGDSVAFSSAVTCPAEPCSYEWDFADGTSSTAASPGSKTFVAARYYPVTLTVTPAGGSGVLSSTAHVTVWNGTFADDFNRSTMGWAEYGWIRPERPGIYWDIQNQAAHVPFHGQRFPGSTGILAAPLVWNGHVEATVLRSTSSTAYHFTDVLVRQHPVLWAQSFYRIRILQSTDGNDTLQMAVFRIDTTTDQHGILLNDRVHVMNGPSCSDDQPCASPEDVMCIAGTCRPFQPRDVPALTGWDPGYTKNIRVIADVVDVAGVPTFRVKFVDASDPSVVWLEQTFTDPLPSPLSYAGLWGLTTFEGDASFDNFLLREKR